MTTKRQGGRQTPRVRRAIKEGEKVRTLLTVKQADTSIEEVLESRVIPFMGTTDAEDRDTDIVEPGGGDFTAFAKNPVFLWCHNNQEPPLGNVLRIEPTENGLLMPTKFNDPKDSEFTMSDGTLVLPDHAKFAEHVFRLYAHRIMNAVSIGFIPKLWEEREHWSFIFKQWEMLELSGCPVPANPEALQQRSRELDESVEAVEEWYGRWMDRTKTPTVQTTVITTIAGKSDDDETEEVEEVDEDGQKEVPPFQEGMPLADSEMEWDGDAAVMRWRELDGSTEEPSETYWMAFAWWDVADRDSFGAYKFPFADVVDDELTVVLAGVNAGLSRVENSDIPEDEKPALRSLLEQYQALFEEEEEDGEGEEEEDGAHEDDDDEGTSTIADDKTCPHCGIDADKLSTLVAIKVARAVENAIAKHSQAPSGAPTTTVGEEPIIFLTEE